MMFRSNSSATADLFDAIRDDLFVAMERIGQEVVARIQEKISVDVEYTVGPRGGIHMIRSLPGEPPRREIGQLQDSYRAYVETDADIVSLDVFSDCPYAAPLELGAPSRNLAPRPHIADTAEEMADDFVDRMVAAVQGG